MHKKSNESLTACFDNMINGLARVSYADLAIRKNTISVADKVPNISLVRTMCDVLFTDHQFVYLEMKVPR